MSSLFQGLAGSQVQPRVSFYPWEIPHPPSHSVPAISQGCSAVCSACCLIKLWKMRLARLRYGGEKKKKKDLASCGALCLKISQLFTQWIPREFLQRSSWWGRMWVDGSAAGVTAGLSECSDQSGKSGITRGAGILGCGEIAGASKQTGLDRTVPRNVSYKTLRFWRFSVEIQKSSWKIPASTVVFLYLLCFEQQFLSCVWEGTQGLSFQYLPGFGAGISLFSKLWVCWVPGSGSLIWHFSPLCAVFSFRGHCFCCSYCQDCFEYNKTLCYSSLGEPSCQKQTKIITVFLSCQM